MSRLTERVRKRWQGVVLDEIGRARRRVRALQKIHPSDSRIELARRLTRAKQMLATAGGALSGMFGFLTIPADVAFTTYLEVALIVDIAVLHGVNLKSPRAQREVLEVLDYAGANHAVLRALPKVAARLLGRFLDRGLAARALPLVAAPVGAVLNRRALARVGETALRFYGTMNQLPRPQ